MACVRGGGLAYNNVLVSVNELQYAGIKVDNGLCVYKPCWRDNGDDGPDSETLASGFKVIALGTINS